MLWLYDVVADLEVTVERLRRLLATGVRDKTDAGPHAAGMSLAGLSRSDLLAKPLPVPLRWGGGQGRLGPQAHHRRALAGWRDGGPAPKAAGPTLRTGIFKSGGDDS